MAGQEGERRTGPRIDQSVRKHWVINFFSIIYRYKELEIYIMKHKVYVILNYESVKLSLH